MRRTTHRWDPCVQIRTASLQAFIKPGSERCLAFQSPVDAPVLAGRYISTNANLLGRIRDQIVHAVALLDPPIGAPTVVMEEAGLRVESARTVTNRRKKLRTIAASNGVKKLGPKEGRTIQVGNTRLTWKATGVDTGYGTSLYEMDLAPGSGIPLHSHPYAEVFYVIAGHTDFLRTDDYGQEEWVRCGPGDTLVAPMNALHAFHNRTGEPSRFISSSVYYHEVVLDRYGLSVDVNDPLPPRREPTKAEGDQFLQVLKDATKDHMYFPQASASSGLEVLREIEKRNSNAPAGRNA
jgi:quercetin dioxygenase-like cupin family protein